jgi:hypothetical protein
MKLRWLFAVALVAAAAAAAAAFAVATHGTTHSAAKAPGSTADSIKVEGHWKITVKNPDGRVVLVRRFHNDPTQAAQAIATVLARAYTPGYWFVQLSSTTSNPACLNAGTPSTCTVIDPADSGAFSTASSTFKTLTTSATGFQSTITLGGSMIAQRNGDVDEVSTNMAVCNRTIAPSTACGLSAFWPFTNRVLGSPINLVTGQQLLVTVTLSFT